MAAGRRFQIELAGLSAVSKAGEAGERETRRGHTEGIAVIVSVSGSEFALYSILNSNQGYRDGTDTARLFQTVPQSIMQRGFDASC